MTDYNLANYVNGAWQTTKGDALNVTNPATGQPIATVPLTSAKEVNQAVDIAANAFKEWKRVPVTERVQYLFELKHLLERHIDEIARLITDECGKTYPESIGELRRGIESVEHACGMPTFLQGRNNEDIARGIDEHLFRQPLGVVAGITPFNFPAMIPLWFLPHALATGNTYIAKPSEQAPITMQRIFELVDQLGLPPGVAQLLNGSKETVDALLDHPAVRAVSFVGSSPVAKYIYSRAAANGKRAQAQGGAKNPVVIMPDADLEMAVRIIRDATYGCAGQRCLRTAVAITVGTAREPFKEMICDAAANIQVGYGLDDGVEMGPVISAQSKIRIEQIVAQADQEGAKVLLDGRGKLVNGYEQGSFVYPVVLDNIDAGSDITRTEIFGPVLSLMHVDSLDEAIALTNASSYGNMVSLFTNSGAHARQFRYEVEAGNIGINIGVAAPMAFFAFAGWKDSFYGDLHAQGHQIVEFYTQNKVVVERWMQDWSRKF